MEELAKHNKQGDLWLAIHGKVYDVSAFMDDHPGGGDVLVDAAGTWCGVYGQVYAWCILCSAYAGSLGPHGVACVARPVSCQLWTQRASSRTLGTARAPGSK